MAEPWQSLAELAKKLGVEPVPTGTNRIDDLILTICVGNKPVPPPPPLPNGRDYSYIQGGINEAPQYRQAGAPTPVAVQEPVAVLEHAVFDAEPQPALTRGGAVWQDHRITFQTTSNSKPYSEPVYAAYSLTEILHAILERTDIMTSLKGKHADTNHRRA